LRIWAGATAGGAPVSQPLQAIERLLSTAAREVQLLSVMSPVGAAAERARLTARLRVGDAERPRWRYAPVAHEDLRRALGAAERLLEGEASGAPLVHVHLARVRELALEASLCAAAGTPAVAALARLRFAPLDEACAREASSLCARWLAEEAEAADDEARLELSSDAPHPDSLLSRLRAEVGRRKLPFAIVVQPSLLPLAATGEQIILVAPGRPTTAGDVARTVLHEIEGHVVPRARARSAPLALFRVGTARGVDEQEGFALVLEERHGCLGVRRRRALAARHFAVEAMARGAEFADVTRALVVDHGFEAEEAVVVAERAFRGGDGVFAGLGRERVYLESFVRVRAHLRERPGDEAVLSSGQVALDAIPALGRFVDCRS
jgi:hypothetical protein